MTSRSRKGLFIALLAVMHLLLSPAMAMACGLGQAGEDCCCVEPSEAVASCCNDPKPSGETPSRRACGCAVSQDGAPMQPLAKTEAGADASDSLGLDPGPEAGLAGVFAPERRSATRGDAPGERPPLFRLYRVYRL